MIFDLISSIISLHFELFIILLLHEPTQLLCAIFFVFCFEAAFYKFLNQNNSKFKTFIFLFFVFYTFLFVCGHIHYKKNQCCFFDKHKQITHVPTTNSKFAFIWTNLTTYMACNMCKSLQYHSKKKTLQFEMKQK